MPNLDDIHPPEGADAVNGRRSQPSDADIVPIDTTQVIQPKQKRSGSVAGLHDGEINSDKLKRQGKYQARRNCLNCSGFFYILYIIPMLVFFFDLAIIFAIPWTYLKYTRPKGFRNAEGKRTRQEFDSKYELEDRGQEVRDVFAKIGNGPEGKEGGTRWMFFSMRTWEMYELLRELWRMLSRQGLQVTGVVSGTLIALMQVIMMIHDFNDSSVSHSMLSLHIQLTLLSLSR